MAQMPPKAPSMAPNWPDFSHQNATQTHNPSWVDDFLDFSAAKRGSHRRSISDSVAFLEMPLEQCRRSGPENTNTEFERFDDEQLMSMFTDDVPGPTMSSSNTSSPSDHNSFNEDNKQTTTTNAAEQQVKKLKSEPEEVQSFCKTEEQPPQPTTTTVATTTTNNDNSNEKIVDPKRIKRILANRQSAQRSRVRKLHYISELERSVTSLQAEVSVLSPRVAFFDHQRMVLTVDNGVLKQRIAALAQDKIFKDAHQEALKREIERLRQIYYQQNLKKMESGPTSPLSKSQPAPPAAMDTNAPAEKGQLVN